MGKPGRPDNTVIATYRVWIDGREVWAEEGESALAVLSALVERGGESRSIVVRSLDGTEQAVQANNPFDPPDCPHRGNPGLCCLDPKECQ